MKVVFIGCVETSYVAFQELIELQREGIITIELLITKKSSSYNSDFKDMTKLAKSAGVDRKFLSAEFDYCKELSEIKYDLLFCVGWSHILPEEVLLQAKLASIGYHPAKLPSNRGRHPLIWALALGLNETASSFFLMEANVDSGSIVDQEIIAIGQDDFAKELYNKILDVIPRQVNRIVRNYSAGSIKPQKQDPSLSNNWRKRTKVDGMIDWRMRAEDIYNLVRALSFPYPGASFIHGTKGYKVKDAHCYETEVSINIEPGKILGKDSNSLHIKCGGSSSIIIFGIDTSEFEQGGYL